MCLVCWCGRGETGPAVLLVHGFGGNCEHWRRNVPELAQTSRVFSIDLLGRWLGMVGW